jgi:hypothetical protein
MLLLLLFLLFLLLLFSQLWLVSLQMWPLCCCRRPLLLLVSQLNHHHIITLSGYHVNSEDIAFLKKKLLGRSKNDCLTSHTLATSRNSTLTVPSSHYMSTSCIIHVCVISCSCRRPSWRIVEHPAAVIWPQPHPEDRPPAGSPRPRVQQTL